MAEKFDLKEKVSIEEFLRYEIITIEALINLLHKKGLLSKQEILEEINTFEAVLEKGHKINVEYELYID
jgi:hypothetical protein